MQYLEVEVREELASGKQHLKAEVKEEITSDEQHLKAEVKKRDDKRRGFKYGVSYDHKTCRVPCRDKRALGMLVGGESSGFIVYASRVPPRSSEAQKSRGLEA